MGKFRHIRLLFFIEFLYKRILTQHSNQNILTYLLGTVWKYLKFLLFSLQRNISRPPPSPPLFSSSKTSGFQIPPPPLFVFLKLFLRFKFVKRINFNSFKNIRGIVTIWLIMPLDHKDMPQVGYYHLEIIQKYLKFFKKDVFLKLILTPPPCFPQVFPQV